MFLFRKKRETKKQTSSEQNKYSVFITDTFTQDDAEVMKPIFTVIFLEDGFKQEAILCKVIDNNGEITLNEAEELMINDIEYILKEGSFCKILIHNTDLNEAEKSVVNKLNILTKETN